MKKSQNLHINNIVCIVKTDNDRRYMGLVVTRNKIIKLLHESTKKETPQESPLTCTPIMYPLIEATKTINMKHQAASQVGFVCLP